MNDIEKLAKNIMGAAGFTEEQVEAMAKIGYFTAPASASHHLAYEGGLLDHSINVTKTLIKLTGVFDVKWERDDAPIYVGMLHDLMKCKCYRRKEGVVENGVRKVDSDFEFVPGFTGHADKSLAIAGELGFELKEDEKAAIKWHMGTFDMKHPTDRRDFEFDLGKFGARVLLTHFADWYAASIIERKISVE